MAAMPVEGGVNVSRPAGLALTNGIAPTLCPQRASCMGGFNSSCAAGANGVGTVLLEVRLSILSPRRALNPLCALEHTRPSERIE